TAPGAGRNRPSLLTVVSSATRTGRHDELAGAVRRRSQMSDVEPEARRDGAVAVMRRAPFSDNPRVGARGQRTQQRILDAALRVFGEDGYYQCSIDRIAKQAGCSR